MRSAVFAILLLLVGVLWAADNVETVMPCTYTSPTTGEKYDLSPLSYDPDGFAPAAGYDYYDTAGNVFYINFCNPVSSHSVSVACNAAYMDGSAVCQLAAGIYRSAGQTNSQTWVDYISDGTYQEGVGLHYNRGEYCPAYQTNRETFLYVSCDENENPGSLYMDRSEACTYTL